MYRIVLDELVRMQQADTQGLPNYTAERMLEELQLFYTYFVDAHCKITLSAEEKQKLDICFAALVQDNASFPQVYVHRDFHSSNLIILTEQTLQPRKNNLQDEIRGP